MRHHKASAEDMYKQAREFARARESGASSSSSTTILQPVVVQAPTIPTINPQRFRMHTPRAKRPNVTPWSDVETPRPMPFPMYVDEEGEHAEPMALESGSGIRRPRAAAPPPARGRPKARTRPPPPQDNEMPEADAPPPQRAPSATAKARPQIKRLALDAPPTAPQPKAKAGGVKKDKTVVKPRRIDHATELDKNPSVEYWTSTNKAYILDQLTKRGQRDVKKIKRETKKELIDMLMPLL